MGWVLMQILSDALGYLKGKKTYIIGILMVTLGFLTKDDKLILEGLGFLALRNAIK